MTKRVTIHRVLGLRMPAATIRADKHYVELFRAYRWSAAIGAAVLHAWAHYGPDCVRLGDQITYAEYIEGRKP